MSAWTPVEVEKFAIYDRVQEKIERTFATREEALEYARTQLEPRPFGNAVDIYVFAVTHVYGKWE